jgi:hypothetical protein
MPDTLRAACEGSQTLSVTVACFGWEAITTPELSGMLPNRMQKETTVLRPRTSYLENRFTAVSHLKQVAVVLKLRRIDFCGLAVSLEGKLYGDT